MTDNNKTAVEQAIIDGSLWAEFCDQLKSAGQVLLRDSTPSDAFNRAEGMRYLTRLLRAGLESAVESSDPHFPRFYQLSNETIKIGNDNPDNIYHNANVDGRLTYRIRGKRGSVNYLSFCTNAGSYATTGTMEPSGQLDSADIQLADDGSFEIIVSSEPQTGNWLPMREDSCSLIVRQTFNDRSAELPAEYTIECLSERGDNRLEPTQFAQQLLGSVQFVKGTANLFIDWMENFSAHINQLPADDQNRCQRAGGDKAIHYMQSYWQLAADEALVIHAPQIPRCKTWNFQLSNFWMESLDYRYHKISVNQHSAAYNDDGSVTVVVAHQNPGAQYPNWLTTAGHDRGSMLWRWVEADSHPGIECQVVKLSQLQQ
jgi:hypothetical protein